MAGRYHLMQSRGGFLGQTANRGGEEHDFSSTRSAVEESALTHFDVEHFFQAHGLCTKLYAIRIMRFRATSFVLYGKRDGRVSWLPVGIDRVKLNHVGDSNEPQTQRSQRNTAGNSHTGARLTHAGMRPLVQMLSFHREPVLDPQPLNVDQCALPLAKQQVLES